VWKLDETWIQVSKQFGTRILARKRSNAVYSTIPKSQEWLTINYVVNVIGGVLLGLYIFRGERLQNDYIKLCKLRICMIMQKKIRMIYFLFKEFLTFFNKFVPSGVSLTN
jgi:hypothetical protein